MLTIQIKARYKEILETKSTQKGNKNTATIKRSEIFTKISKEQLPKKTGTQLEKCYSNLRQRVIAKKRHNDSEKMKTGSGVPNIKPYKDYEEKLLEIMTFSKPIDEVANSSSSSSIVCEETPSKINKIGAPNLRDEQLKFLEEENLRNSHTSSLSALVSLLKLPTDEQEKFANLIEYHRNNIESSYEAFKEKDEFFL